MTPEKIAEAARMYPEELLKGAEFWQAVSRVYNAQERLEGYRDTIKSIKEHLPAAEAEMHAACEALRALGANP